MEMISLPINVAICSIVRNCAKQLEKNILVVEELRKYFKSSIVIIYENDSIDDTKLILKSWQKKSKRVMLKSDSFNEETIPHNCASVANRYFSKARISKMASFRNNYLIELDRLNEKFDFVIILDLDVARIDTKGILNSFELSNQWDIVTSNGYSFSPQMKKRFHDTYALVEIGNENQSQTEDSIFENQNKWSFLKIGQPLIPVYSAFGGLAIYKYHLLNGVRYGILENRDLKVEVRCEHFFLHDQIIKRHKAKIFINPNMTILYQRVDLKLILKTIKEKLNKYLK